MLNSQFTVFQRQTQSRQSCWNDIAALSVRFGPCPAQLLEQNHQKAADAFNLHHLECSCAFAGYASRWTLSYPASLRSSTTLEIPSWSCWGCDGVLLTTTLLMPLALMILGQQNTRCRTASPLPQTVLMRQG
jgi:hypothetical protein